MARRGRAPSSIQHRERSPQRLLVVVVLGERVGLVVRTLTLGPEVGRDEGSPVDHQPDTARRASRSITRVARRTSRATTPARPGTTRSRLSGRTARAPPSLRAPYGRRSPASHAASARAACSGREEQGIAVLAPQRSSASSSIEAAPGVASPNCRLRPTPMRGSSVATRVLSPLPSTDVAVSSASSNRPAVERARWRASPRSIACARGEPAVVHERERRFRVPERLARLPVRARSTRSGCSTPASVGSSRPAAWARRRPDCSSPHTRRSPTSQLRVLPIRR